MSHLRGSTKRPNLLYILLSSFLKNEALTIRKGKGEGSDLISYTDLLDLYDRFKGFETHCGVDSPHSELTVCVPLISVSLVNLLLLQPLSSTLPRVSVGSYSSSSSPTPTDGRTGVRRTSNQILST